MALTFAENVTSQDLHVDTLFFTSYGLSTLFPNRPSPVTSLCFILLGWALFWASFRGYPRLRLTFIGMLASCVSLTAFVAMFGCTFGIEAASGWGAYTRMSPYAGITFIIVGTGLLVWAWRSAGDEGLNFLRWLPVSGSGTLMVMIAIISTASFFQLKTSNAWRRHTYDVLDVCQLLQSDLFDMQRGVRGYVITGKANSLDHYRSGVKSIPQDIQDLLFLTRENQMEQINLRLLNDKYLALNAYSLKLMQAKNRSLTQAVQMDSTGIGFSLLNDTLQDLHLIVDEERRLLVTRSATADSDFNNTARLLIFGSVLAAALLIIANAMASREVRLRQETEGRLRSSNFEFEAARERAEKASQAKSAFLSSMSHELRTPLNAILGFAQLMESSSPAPNESQDRSIKQILKSGWRLLKLINEVLDLAAIESGKLQLSKESVLIAGVIKSCQEMLEIEASLKNVKLLIHESDPPIYVQADRTRLEQILTNLLSNAIKYNQDGGTVEVFCTLSPSSRIRICVKDTGSGLSSEKQEQLFQPFNRLGQEATRIVGTGIGLVVSKHLAESMAGSLGVESDEGIGSLFWCELPLAEAPCVVSSNSASILRSKSMTVDSVQIRTVLYVEDNPANLDLVKEIITRCPGLKLITAVDAISGIECAQSLKPDVILMDINLSGMNGIEAFKILRENPSTSPIPVIALSANAMPRDIEKGLKEGFFDYLTKPIQLSPFIVALQRALKASERALLSV